MANHPHTRSSLRSLRLAATASAVEAVYEQTTKDMQQRITMARQQIEQQNLGRGRRKEGKRSDNLSLRSRAEASQKVIFEQNQVGAQYQGTLPSEPTYDLLQEAQSEIASLKQQVGTLNSTGISVPDMA